MQAKITQTNLPKFKPQEKPYDVRDTQLTGFLLRVLPTRADGTSRKVYYCQYARGKREKLGIVPAVTPEQAREKAKKMLAGITLDNETPQQKKEKERVQKKREITLENFLTEKYEPWVTTNRKSGKATIARLKANYIEELGDLKLYEICEEVADAWCTKRLEAGKKRTTINRDMTTLKAALSKATEWKYLEENPLKDYKPLKVDTGGVVRYLEDDEHKRLRDALAARDKQKIAERASGNEWRKQRGYELKPAIKGPYCDHLTPAVLLTLNTGLRRGELLSLTWGAVNLQTNTLTLKAENTKSETTRHLPLNQEARDVLEAWGKQTGREGLVFKARDGGKLDNMKKSWAGVLKAANIEKFRWHDLRHDFASKLVMAGCDLNTVRELLGHSDIKMTLRYSHLAPEHKLAAVALLDGGR